MALKIGDKAPAIVLPNQDNQMVDLDDLLGKWLVIYFYPKDNTPGCIIEAKDFSCLQEEFAQAGVQVVGISKDSIQSHQRFISKQELSLQLLSDADLTTIKAYDTWRKKKMYGKSFLGVIRSTFLIDPRGDINEAWYNVKAKEHAQKVLEEVRKKISK
ncbi:MAG: peroxiredoxin [Candidatus Stygibacter australis]|nr:peroxiredoxin [Candidatus Stygibacter australis]MDP8323435.1 peroxiredoxin [Candidatus Stygibacter australis]